MRVATGGLKSAADAEVAWHMVFWIGYVFLWLLTVTLAFVTMMLLREHVGVLRSLRDGRSRLGGPPDGDKAPRLPAEAELRREKTTSTSIERAGLRIVVFMGVHCKACWEYRGPISAFAQDRAEFVEVVLSCVGNRDEVASVTDGIVDNVRVFADPRGRTARRWRVFMTPFAVAIGGDGRVQEKLATPTFDNLVMLLARMMDDSVEETETTNAN